MHTAAFWGRTEIAAQLIAAKADVNALDEHHCTPLHEGARLGSLSVVRSPWANSATAATYCLIVPAALRCSSSSRIILLRRGVMSEVARVSGHPWSPVSCIFPGVLDSGRGTGENATKPWKSRHFRRFRRELPNFPGKVPTRALPKDAHGRWESATFSSRTAAHPGCQGCLQGGSWF